MKYEPRRRFVKDRNILETVRGLLSSEAAFQDILEKYRNGSLHFSDIEGWVDDRGQSLLYRLKQQCHSIFRSQGREPAHRSEWLLDLAIGSVFHEAMKLRENLYQLEFYRPRYREFKAKVGSSSHERDLLHQFERIMAKAEEGLREGIEETRSLFQDAMAQLIDFFKINSRNPLLVRLLLEQQALLKKVYGSQGVRDVFRSMFPKGMWQAYDFAGRSYLRSRHYDLACAYLSKALRQSPDNPDLRFLLQFSQGMKAYYQHAHARALSRLSKLVRLSAAPGLKRDCLGKAAEVCQRISVEFRDERKNAAAQRCRSLAEEMKNVL